jgi:hypothetical protein
VGAAKGAFALASSQNAKHGMNGAPAPSPALAIGRRYDRLTPAEIRAGRLSDNSTLRARSARAESFPALCLRAIPNQLETKHKALQRHPTMVHEQEVEATFKGRQSCYCW